MKKEGLRVNMNETTIRVTGRKLNTICKWEDTPFGVGGGGVGVSSILYTMCER